MDNTSCHKINVESYTAARNAQWDSFVTKDSRNGCLFHERKFLSYHEAGRYEDASLILTDGAKITGVIPAALIESSGRRTVVSHPGSSAGGLVFHKRSRLCDILNMLETAIMHYQNKGVTTLELRLAEPVFAFPVDGELTYLLWHRGFKLIAREISSCVNLQSQNSWRFYGRRKNTTDRNNAIKSGVTIIRCQESEQIYHVIAENLGNKYGKSPTHTLSELNKLKTMYPDKIDLWAAEQNNKVLATVVVFIVNEHAVHSFYIAQQQALPVQTMPLLFETVFNHYSMAGFKWFNFGISSRGSWIKWGIQEFKEKMGARGTFREIWQLDDLQNYQTYVHEEGCNGYGTRQRTH